MLGKRTLAGTGIAAAALAVAVGGQAGAASPVAHPASHVRLVVAAGHGSDRVTVAAWRTALSVRSDALNRRYHLGKYARASLSTDAVAVAP
jgi:hypothetical protein